MPLKTDQPPWQQRLPGSEPFKRETPTAGPRPLSRPGPDRSLNEGGLGGAQARPGARPGSHVSVYRLSPATCCSVSRGCQVGFSGQGSFQKGRGAGWEGFLEVTPRETNVVKWRDKKERPESPDGSGPSSLLLRATEGGGCQMQELVPVSPKGCSLSCNDVSGLLHSAPPGPLATVSSCLPPPDLRPPPPVSPCPPVPSPVLSR